VAALDQEHPEPVDGGGFSDSGRAGDADPDSLSGIGQQHLHQIARGGLVIGAAALDQRDRPRQRGVVASTEAFGEGFDIDGSIIRQRHALVYNGGARQARGSQRS